MDEYDHQFKFLIIGDSAVGKSCILLRFLDDSFSETQLMSLGTDFKVKQLVIRDKNIQLQVWDTAGQERFRTITSSFYRGAHAIILTFDLTSRDSFDSLESWLLETTRYACEKVMVVMVGNKSDLPDRAVTHEEAQAFADKEGLAYFETSAKTGENVEKVFTELATAVLDQQTSQPESETSLAIRAAQRRKEKKSFCLV